MDSPSGSTTPLQAATPERVNQQRESLLFSPGHPGYDLTLNMDAIGNGGSNNTSPTRGGVRLSTSVTDKISQFNSLSMSMQSKQLERKTADAALKRAMLGREEAETEMRRYRDEMRQMRKQVEEGQMRERRVGERLETVMENYGRAKETHAHTQALWEKEIRRARKETFKSQSVIVRLQEEIKAVRMSTKSAEEALEHEKQRSQTREQEAFQARYELVGCQEELQQTLLKVKMLEQERDAFKSLARSKEDVARIASEGRLPLPPPDADEEAEVNEPAENNDNQDTEEDHENSLGEPQSEGEDLVIPKRKSNKNKPRLSSMALLDIKSSATSEAEIEELTRLWQWEKQRANRAADLVDYLEAECHLRACSCMKKRPRTSTVRDSARKRPNLDIADGGDRMLLSEKAAGLSSPSEKIRVNVQSPSRAVALENGTLKPQHKKKGPRLSTVFIPEEGVFRTVSQQIAEEMERADTAIVLKEPAEEEAHVEALGDVGRERGVAEVGVTKPQETQEPDSAHDDADTTVGDITRHTTDRSMYARTPSVDPPSFALLAQERTSLLSLLDAPHRQEPEPPISFHVPTTPASQADIQMQRPAAASILIANNGSQDDVDVTMVDAQEEQVQQAEAVAIEETRGSDITAIFSHSRRHEHHASHQERPAVEDVVILEDAPVSMQAAPIVAPLETPLPQQPFSGPATFASSFSSQTTTTKVPLREETTDPSLAQRILSAQRTPTHKTVPSYDNINSDGSSAYSFDVNNPAMTPTMTREQCLAQIRERRGRARSAHATTGGSNTSTSSNNGHATVTPRQPVTPGKERREVSAPVGRMASARRVRS